MSKTETPEHESRTAEAIGKFLRVAAYPISAVSGYVAGDVYTRGMIYKAFARQGFFDGKSLHDSKRGGLQGELGSEFTHVVRDIYKQKILSEKDPVKLRRYIKNAIRFSVYDELQISTFAKEEGNTLVETIFAESKAKGEELGTMAKSFKEISQQAEHSASKRFSLLNAKYRIAVREFFHDIGIKDPISYMKVANVNQRLEAGIFALTVVGVSLGAMLAVSHNKGLLDALSHKSQSNDTTAVARS